MLQQNSLQWYGHVLRKEDNDWVKKCMEYEVGGSRTWARPKRTWTEVVEKDCQVCKLNKEDAMDRSRWRKLIKDVWWSGWVWVGECFFWYQPTQVVPLGAGVLWRVGGSVWEFQQWSPCAVDLFCILPLTFADLRQKWHLLSVVRANTLPMKVVRFRATKIVLYLTMCRICTLVNYKWSM